MTIFVTRYVDGWIVWVCFFMSVFLGSFFSVSVSGYAKISFPFLLNMLVECCLVGVLVVLVIRLSIFGF